MVVEEKIKWCGDQKRGIRFVEPNRNLSDEYMDYPDDTLLNFMLEIK
ncbi:MAG: hypothetical protein K0B07_03935 [DPANN group archaeon]|nr:hypothetical protein [DPANN group archaeon]